jgi:ubiquinone/menaquinone biosynthesis C-methylase UbiE
MVEAHHEFRGRQRLPTDTMWVLSMLQREILVTIGFDLLNRPMLPKDIAWVHSQPEYRVLCDLVRQYSEQELPVFNGGLRNSNLVYVDDGFKLTHWFRMWEYLSVYHYALKPLGRDAKILDCGGAGSCFPFWLGEQGRHVRVIDIQSFHTSLSNLVAEARGLESLEFAAESMMDIKASDNTFDCVYSVSVLEHLPPEEREKALREIHRVLKPNGTLALTFDFGDDVVLHPGRSHGSLVCVASISEISSLLENSPFEIVGNDLAPEMDLLKKERPGRQEFECRYMLTKTMTANSGWIEAIRWLIGFFAYKVSHRVAFQVVPKATGSYNFFRLFLRKVE